MLIVVMVREHRCHFFNCKCNSLLFTKIIILVEKAKANFVFLWNFIKNIYISCISEIYSLFLQCNAA